MKPLQTNAGLSLPELLIAAAVAGLALAATFSGSTTLQRCFVASQEFAADKTEQARLNDYLALDLRRATKVEAGTGNVILTLTLPSYLDDTGKPITPTIVRQDGTYAVQYGATPTTVVYRRYNSTITRTVDSETPLVIAQNVSDFECNFEGIGTSDVIRTRITFLPSLQRSGAAGAASRAATTVYNVIPLRN
jgi:prepilin-type N-terminal cleavage/methylation domain-containing protein